MDDSSDLAHGMGPVNWRTPRIPKLSISECLDGAPSRSSSKTRSTKLLELSGGLELGSVSVVSQHAFPFLW